MADFQLFELWCDAVPQLYVDHSPSLHDDLDSVFPPADFRLAGFFVEAPVRDSVTRQPYRERWCFLVASRIPLSSDCILVRHRILASDISCRLGPTTGYPFDMQQLSQDLKPWFDDRTKNPEYPEAIDDCKPCLGPFFGSHNEITDFFQPSAYPCGLSLSCLIPPVILDSLSCSVLCTRTGYSLFFGLILLVSISIFCYPLV